MEPLEKVIGTTGTVTLRDINVSSKKQRINEIRHFKTDCP